MTRRRLSVLPALLVLVSSSLHGQTTVTKPGQLIKKSATIVQIDSTSRIITYKGEDGSEDRMWAPPSIARFDELKVGDRINMTYYESTIFQVRKPGAPAPKPSDQTAATATSGTLPGGTVARQANATVTVKAVDPAVPSITVTTSDGRTITRKVAQKSYLDGVKPGDQIDITYTEAVVATVERGK